MSEKVITVGTRKSSLALAQTESVIALLRSFNPGREFSVRPISTAGDREADHQSLPDHQGIFVKEIEDALLKGEIDLAVHSLKDMPCDVHKGLEMGAIVARVDPRDALLARDHVKFMDLKPGAKIGTSSVRRRAQITFARKDLEVVELRGNVDTRIGKLEAGEVDAILIATAGVIRLGKEQLITERMALEVMLPAPCQGALAVEIRRGDEKTRSVVRAIDHELTSACALAERSFLMNLGGGCSLPVGALAIVKKGKMTLMGEVISPDGAKKTNRMVTGEPNDAFALGAKLARDLLDPELGGDWVRSALEGLKSGK